ncbi:MAG TPA: CPBP family intramembrane glutamic endopeptidase [Usitatibacter sp.]|jgi:membrane protease YdiL (CAAX protease family)|nr:CPBP family intramembrane glutamic endopeptidase [Usitatibacter sp.]
MADRSPPAPLVTGAVRGWHVLLLYWLIYLSMTVASGKLTRGMPADIRQAWGNLVLQGVSALLVVLVAVIVPELRRSLPRLYARHGGGLSLPDVALCLGLMLAWGLGAHRLLLLWPALQWNPSSFDTLGFAEHASRPSGIAGLLMLLSSVIIAPMAEELVFRGFLLNLWRHRWGLRWGIVLSSIAFGAAHFQYTIFAAVTGVLLCLVYLRFGTLWQGTILHSLYNLVAGPFGFSLWFVEKSRADVQSLSAWVPEIALTAAFFPLALLFWRRFRPAS